MITSTVSCKQPGAHDTNPSNEAQFSTHFWGMIVLILNCNEINKIDSANNEKCCYQPLISVDWSIQSTPIQKWLSVVINLLIGMSDIGFYFFCKPASGRNPPNPAIWLVPGAGGILQSCPLTRAESLAGSFTSLFVVCEWAKTVILKPFFF